MKRAAALIAIGVLAVAAGMAARTTHAATGAPQILNYQGRLMDGSGTLLGGAGTNYCFRFSLYDSPTVGSGTKLWPASTPSDMVVSVKNGVFNVGIGDTNAGGDALTYNFQDSDSVYLNVEVASYTGSCGAYETLSPRQRLFSSAYALNANTVGGFSAAQAASGTEVTALTNDQLILGGSNAGVSASGANALIIQSSGSGDVQFFNTSNKITSAGDMTLTGGLYTNSLSSNTTLAVGGTATTTLQGSPTGTSTIQGVINVLGTNSTSTFSGGVAAVALAVTGGATSTFARGINIANGCFAVNGVCVVGINDGIVAVAHGGTGTSTAPGYGQVLVGNATGGFDYVATSTFADGTFSTTSADYWGGQQGYDVFAYLFGPVLDFSTSTAATSSSIYTAGVFFASSTAAASQLPFASSTAITVAGTASTTALVVSSLGISAGQCLTTNSSGSVTTTSCGSGGALPFTFTTVNGLADTAATSSPLAVFNAASFGSTGTTTITAAGFLGVGSTSPSALLSVNANVGSTNTTLFAIGSSTAANDQTLFSVDNTGLTTVGNASGTGDAVFQFGSDANAWAIGYNSSDQSFDIASATNLSVTPALSIAKNGNATFNGNLIFSALSNCSGTLKTDVSGNVFCGGVSSGGSGAWATTTDGLAVYPTVSSEVVLIGQTSTTTTGNILEVGGNSLLRGALTAYNTVTAPVFSATSTTATSTFADGIDLSGGCFSVNGTCINGGSSASSTLLSDQNTFTGIDSFTNASSNFAGTWQGYNPSAFQAAGAYLTSYDAWTHPGYGGSATTSLLTLSGGLLAVGSTTLVGNATTTGNFSAGSLTLAGTRFTSANISQWTNDAGFATFGYPFPAGATTSQVAFNGGLTASGATTTALAVTGSTTVTGVFNAPGGIAGNASSATALQTPRTINGVSFDGTANITVASTSLLGDANTFTGIDSFTNASSNFAGTWQGYNPSAFQAAGAYLTSYDAWTHPAAGVSATTSGIIINAASSTIVGNATTTGVLYAGTASSSKLFGSNLSACNGASNALTWTGGTFGCNTITAGSAASTTLLGDSNTWSGTDTFTKLVTLSGGASTTGEISAGTASTTALFISSLGPSAGSCLTVNSSGSVTTTSCGGVATPQSEFTFPTVNSALAMATTTPLAVFNAAYFGSTGTTTVTAGGSLGIGTTSPYAMLAIAAASSSYSTNTLFAVASSTSSFSTTTLFSISNTGNSVLLGTASSTNLIVSSLGASAGQCLTINASGSVTTTGCGAFGWTPTTFGTTAANSTSTLLIASGGFVSGSTTLGLLTATSSAVLASTTLTGNTLLGSATSTNFAVAGSSTVASTFNVGGTALFNSKIGIGTTSPFAQLSIFTGSDFGAHAVSTLFAVGSTTAGTATTTVFSISSTGLTSITNSTAAQLSIGDTNPNTSDWSFRGINGNFYLATSSPTTLATSTIPTLAIIAGGTSGAIGIGSSTPWGKFSIEMGPLHPAFVISNQGSSTPAFMVGGVNANGWVAVGTSSPSINTVFVIATSSASTTNLAALSIQSAGVTTTINFFGATTTGLTSGVGAGVSSSSQNLIIVGNGKAKASMSIINGNLCVDNDGWCNAPTTTGTVIARNGFETANVDLAENFPSSDALVPGEIVDTAPAGGSNVALAQYGDGNTLVGVVSTAPGFLLGEGGGYPIALAGRVPVLINLEGGDIAPGDPITVSSVAGVGKKATTTDFILGYAIDSYTGTGNTVEMYISRSTYIADTQLHIGDTYGRIGVASTSPFARFSIHANADSSGITTLFAIGSSTANATTTLFSISNTGNSVLLGTASSTNLVISSLGGSAGQCLTTDSSGTVTTTSCGAGGGGSGFTFTTVNGLTDTAATSSPLAVFNAASFGSTGTTTVTQAGLLGVGTSTPFAALAVSANAGSTYPGDNLFVIASSTASGTATLFSVDNTGLTTVGNASGTGDAVFQFAGDTNAWAVGYKSSDKSFNIASSTNLTGTAAISISKTGTTTFSGQGGTCYIDGSTNCTSDARLKNIIATTTGADALAGLAKIDTVTYHWADPALSQGERLGVIAQQVLAAFPDLVGQGTVNFEGTPGTYYTVDYAGLTAPLIAGVNQLNLDYGGLASTTASTTSQLGTLASTTGALSSALASTSAALASTTAALTQLSQNGLNLVSGIDSTLTLVNGVLGLNFSNPNIWTGLQSFGAASTTAVSALNYAAVGTTATTTIRGDAATSTFSGGINVAGGCFAVDGVCLVARPNQGDDIALWYPTQGDVAPGDIVAVASSSTGSTDLAASAVMVKAEQGSRAVGVVSSASGEVLGGVPASSTNPQTVALAGRVAVNVSDENGAIKAGDYLTLSSIPGVAMRATQAGESIGVALSDERCDSGAASTSMCQALVAVGTAYTPGATLKAAMSEAGLDLSAIPADADPSRLALAQLLKEKERITASTSLSEISTGRLTAGLEVIAPRVVTQTLVTDAIEPVDQNVNLKLLPDGTFTITSAAQGDLSVTFGTTSTSTGELVVSIDARGNATFAGTVSAAGLTVGTPQAPTGITLYDGSGAPYCAKIVDKTLETFAGVCGAESSTPASPASSSVSTSTATSTPALGGPSITVNGNNPSYVPLGTTYADLGATVTDSAEPNLGYDTLVNGTQVTSVSLDTSTTTQYTVTYVAVDSAGNTAQATRTVFVGSAPPDAQTASSTATVDTAQAVQLTQDASSTPAQTPDADAASGTAASSTPQN